jgi:hypothetical protein
MPENTTEDTVTEPIEETVDTPADATPATPEPEIKDPKALLATLDAIRKEKREAEKELKVLRSKVKDHEDAQLTEAQRLQQQLEEITADRDRLMLEARTALATTALTAAATKAQAIRSDAVVKLADAAALAEDGSNADELIADIRKTYPELFKASPGPADAGSGKGNAPTRDINALIRQALGH